MSPLRITTLLIASVLTAVSTLGIIDVADGGTQAVADSVVIIVTCASLSAWISFIALTVGDKVCGRLDQLEDYGDQREGNGYLTSVRETSTSGQLHRVK